jgi:hypothetical protein
VLSLSTYHFFCLSAMLQMANAGQTLTIYLPQTAAALPLGLGDFPPAGPGYAGLSVFVGIQAVDPTHCTAETRNEVP